MELTFNKSEFEHVPKKSVYNHNYYRHKKLHYIILEVCFEDENYCDLFLIEDDDTAVFIGSYEDWLDNVSDIKIEFKNPFT